MKNLPIICAAAVVVLAVAGMAQAADTVFVDGSKVNPMPPYYPTIPEAVDAVDPGGTVYILGPPNTDDPEWDGNYSDHTEVYKTCDIILYEDSEVNLYPHPYHPNSIFYITADNVNIIPHPDWPDYSFNIYGEPLYPAIIFEDVNNGLFEGHKIYAGQTSIHLLNSTNVTIRDNELYTVHLGFEQNNNGVELTTSSYCTIEDNDIDGQSSGIYINDVLEGPGSNHNIIHNNTLTHPLVENDPNILDGKGIYVGQNCVSNIITDNTITGWSQFMHPDKLAEVGCGIDLNIKCPGYAIVTGNTISDCGNGIKLNVSDCNISNNTIQDCNGHPASTYDGFGILFSDTNDQSGNVITGNTITGSLIGIYFPSNEATGLDTITFTCNKIYDNNDWGMRLDYDLGYPVVIVDARDNWWGDASGPYDDKSLPGEPNYKNPFGIANAVTSYIDYFPWKVDPNGTQPYKLVQNQVQWKYYSEIQTAINEANDNDVIYALAGTYEEDLDIIGLDGLELYGEGCGNSIIKGVASEPWPSYPLAVPNIDLRANDVKIHDFQIESPDVPDGEYSSGIVLAGTDVEINDICFVSIAAGDGACIVIQTYRDNVLGYDSDISDLYIHDNTFEGAVPDGYVGVFLNHTTVGTGPVRVADNAFTGNLYYGVFTERDNTKIINNTIVTDVVTGTGVVVMDFNLRPQSDVSVKLNTIDGFTTGMKIGDSGGVQDLTNIQVGTTISLGGECGYMQGFVGQNVVENCDVGIRVRADASDVLMSGNEIRDNGVGVQNDHTNTLYAKSHYWNGNTTDTVGIVETDALTAPISDSEHNPYPAGDMNYDRAVDLFDLAVLANNWLEGTE